MEGIPAVYLQNLVGFLQQGERPPEINLVGFSSDIVQNSGVKYPDLLHGHKLDRLVVDTMNSGVYDTILSTHSNLRLKQLEQSHVEGLALFALGDKPKNYGIFNRGTREQYQNGLHDKKQELISAIKERLKTIVQEEILNKKEAFKKAKMDLAKAEQELR